MLGTYDLAAFCSNCGYRIYTKTTTTDDIDTWLSKLIPGEVACDNCQSKNLVGQRPLTVALLP